MQLTCSVTLVNKTISEINIITKARFVLSHLSICVLVFVPVVIVVNISRSWSLRVMANTCATLSTRAKRQSSIALTLATMKTAIGDSFSTNFTSFANQISKININLTGRTKLRCQTVLLCIMLIAYEVRNVLVAVVDEKAPCHWYLFDFYPRPRLFWVIVYILAIGSLALQCVSIAAMAAMCPASFDVFVKMFCPLHSLRAATDIRMTRQQIAQLQRLCKVVTYAQVRGARCMAIFVATLDSFAWLSGDDPRFGISPVVWRIFLSYLCFIVAESFVYPAGFLTVLSVIIKRIELLHNELRECTDRKCFRCVILSVDELSNDILKCDAVASRIIGGELITLFPALCVLIYYVINTRSNVMIHVLVNAMVFLAFAIVYFVMMPVAGITDEYKAIFTEITRAIMKFPLNMCNTTYSRSKALRTLRVLSQLSFKRKPLGLTAYGLMIVTMLVVFKMFLTMYRLNLLAKKLSHRLE